MEAPGKFLGSVFRPGAHPESNIDYGDMAHWFSDSLALWVSGSLRSYIGIGDNLRPSRNQLGINLEPYWGQVFGYHMLGSYIDFKYWDHILEPNIGVTHRCRILGSDIVITYRD